MDSPYYFDYPQFLPIAAIIPAIAPMPPLIAIAVDKGDALAGMLRYQNVVGRLRIVVAQRKRAGVDAGLLPLTLKDNGVASDLAWVITLDPREQRHLIADIAAAGTLSIRFTTEHSDRVLSFNVSTSELLQALDGALAAPRTAKQAA